MAVETDEFHGRGAGGQPLCRQLAAHGGGVDGPHSMHAGGVVGNVESRSEPNFDDLALELGGDAGADRLELFAGHDDVRGPGDDLIGVEAHAGSRIPPAWVVDGRCLSAR